MDKKQFKEQTERLIEVGVVIEKLPVEIRNAAFSLLEGYVVGAPPEVGEATNSRRPSGNSPQAADSMEIFSKHIHDKPADNVKLIAAYFYGNYGSEPFSADDIKLLAREVGITIPDRPDATLMAAVSQGKKLFNSAGRGKYKVTVHGEAYLKEAYEIKKGTQTRLEQPE